MKKRSKYFLKIIIFYYWCFVMAISLSPHAKINLHLEVGKKREDGFHEISSLMQEISISDEMTVGLADSNGCNLRVLGSSIGEDNTITRSFYAFQKVTGIRHGIDVSLLKKIPIGAGLGGASSDAASLIQAMDRLFDTRLEREKLSEIALEVGSDVPFFLTGGSAIVQGRGEKVKRTRLETSYVGILVYPEFPSFTKEAYQLLDQRNEDRHDKSELDIEAANLFESPLFNHFETPLFARYPELKEIKDSFTNFACDFALMSGAGSGVYALFRDWEKAKNAHYSLAKKWKNCTFFIPVEK